jgi:hypothetical protein
VLLGLYPTEAVALSKLLEQELPEARRHGRLNMQGVKDGARTADKLDLGGKAAAPRLKPPA